MVVDKDFCKFTDDFGKHMACRKGKSIARISTYSSQDKVVSFPHRNWSRAVKRPPAYCLFIQEVMLHLEGSVGLSCGHIWHSAAVSRSALGIRKSMLLSPCVMFIFATMATLFMALRYHVRLLSLFPSRGFLMWKSGR